MIRVPGWLYRPIMWLSQPRRAALITTALYTLAGALLWTRLDGVLRAALIGVWVLLLAWLGYAAQRAEDREKRQG